MSGLKHKATIQMTLCILLVLIVPIFRKTSAITVDDFYPFGLRNGDNQLTIADDENNESALDIDFISSFILFGKHYNIISVLTNGLLSLNHSDVSSNYSPKRFPTNGTLIAPFWADADTREIGQVYYRSTTNQTLLEKMTQDINETVGEMFFPEYLFMSTWHEVGYYDRKTDKTNTFQCVLATDHTTSYILFLYEKGGIQWARGDQISNDLNSGSGYATVGFNAGDGENYEVLPGSNTADVIGIANTSNVGIPGLWVFQVNQAQNLTTTDPCVPHPCDANANCTKGDANGDFICSCIFPYSGNGTVCTEIPVMTTTTTVLTNNTSNDVTISKDDIITNASSSSSTAFMATDSVHMDSKVTNRVTTSLLIFVGVLLLLLLPGAIYGFVKVCKIITTYKIKIFKDSATSVDEKYIIVHKTT